MALIEFIIALAGMGVLIISLTHVSLWIGYRESQNEKEEDRRRDEEKQERHAKKYQTNADAFLSHFQAFSDQLYAQNKKQARNERKHTLLEVWGITAASAAAAFALWSAWIFQGQLNEMRYDRRPWAFITDAVIYDDLVWDDLGGASIHLRFTVKNAGQSPAENTFIAVNIFSGPHISVSGKQSEVCAPVRNQPTFIQASETIFPGDSVIFDEVVRILPSDIKAALNPTIFPNGTRMLPNIVPVIVGCVDYELEWDKTKHHQTPLSYILSKRDDKFPNSRLAITFDQSTRRIKGDDLRLEKNALGAGGAPAD